MKSVLVSIFLLLFLLTISVPLGFSFGISAVFLQKILNLTPAFLASIPFRSINSFPLMAIPFFLLAGEIMRVGGLSEKLIDFANFLLGKSKGALGSVMVLSCLFFGAISGSAVATVAAIGSIMIPRMNKDGYKKEYTTALVASAGALGAAIPPSVPLILYGVSAGVSIGALFLATIIPGLIMAILLLITNYVCTRRLVINQNQPNAKNIIVIMKKSTPALVLPVIILGGIYGGVFTPTEAAAVAVVYALAISFIEKSTDIKKTRTAFFNAAYATSVIMIILVFVSLLVRYLNILAVPQQVADLFIGVTQNKILFLIMLNLFVLLVGMFMDVTTAMIILTPLLSPTIVKFGIDPLHFGIILSINLAVGMITPPFCANVFVAARISNVQVHHVFKYLGPILLFAMIPCLLLVTYIPQISLFLPKLFY